MMSANETKLSIDEERAKARRMNQIRTYLPVVGLVAIFILFIFLTDGKMIAPKNLILLMNQVYVVMIAAMGVFFIMTMGGLDFSQGSILGISSIVICLLSPHGIGVAILGGIAAGACIGAINAYFHVCRKIASFIVTICTMFLFRGFIKYFTSDSPIRASMTVYDYDSIELKLTCTVVIVLIGFLAFRYTPFGTYLKAIGSGERGAMFAGIRTDRMKFFIYTLAGALTGFAAFLNIVKNGSATANVGNQLETQILIALVLGGMPISGGAKVRFGNIIVGSLLFYVLYSGLTMIGLSTQELQLIEGIIFLIFVAVFADRKALKVIK